MRLARTLPPSAKGDALWGAFRQRIKSEHLIKTIATLLEALGVLILFEVAYPFQYAHVIPAGAASHFGVGFALGIIIGLVSSILDVAGGELLIPIGWFSTAFASQAVL